MRQRKVKDLDNKLEAVRSFQVTELSPEIWQSVFEPGRDLYLEIGCGKGDFLLQQAIQNPSNDYIGIEGQASVVLRAMEKADRISQGNQSLPLDNLRFACAFVQRMEDLFAPDSLSGIYLNFSDPWPKGRHAKRRLTYRGRLLDYAKALRSGGFIAFKTDNDPLFEFTLEEIAACGWTPAEVTRDLHGENCTYEARRVMTEYERKFRSAGKNINYVKVIV